MERILFVTHTEEDGGLSRVSLETLKAAKTVSESLRGGLLVGLFGGDVKKAADIVAATAPEKILGAAGEAFAASRYATDAAAIEAICRASAATLVVAPATSRISRVLAGVCQRLGGRMDSHVTAFSVADGAFGVRRWFYRQRMEALLKRTQRPWFVTVDSGSFEAWSGGTGSAEIEMLSVTAGDAIKRTRVEGFIIPPADKQTIRPDAKLLFVAGAGWTKKQADGNVHAEEAARLILGFLKKSGASLGGSKSLVDISGEGHAVLPFMTHLHQVGQTGATPRHPKGLATCCHGEEPHVVGWRFINERRVINLNPSCGWAQGKADVVYVADAFEVMAKVNALL